MGDYSQEQLEAMGLCPNREHLDQRLPYAAWANRRNYHTFVENTTNQPEKPESALMWRCEQGNTILTAVRCNAGIHIVKLSAIVTGGGAEGVDKPLADEYYLCQK